MNQITDYEIMAPVGSRDSLAAALKAGAGSVYFGVEQLNMRSHSANHFTIDDLREIASTCKVPYQVDLEMELVDGSLRGSYSLPVYEVHRISHLIAPIAHT